MVLVFSSLMPPFSWAKRNSATHQDFRLASGFSRKREPLRKCRSHHGSDIIGCVWMCINVREGETPMSSNTALRINLQRHDCWASLARCKSRNETSRLCPILWWMSCLLNNRFLALSYTVMKVILPHQKRSEQRETAWMCGLKRKKTLHHQVLSGMVQRFPVRCYGRHDSSREKRCSRNIAPLASEW